MTKSGVASELFGVPLFSPIVLVLSTIPCTFACFPCSCRDLGEHGFLVEGSVITSKRDAESESIPYKYVVYNRKKPDYEYEFIYKLDSEHVTNRCLFVKPHLLNSDGNLLVYRVNCYFFA